MPSSARRAAGGAAGGGGVGRRCACDSGVVTRAPPGLPAERARGGGGGGGGRAAWPGPEEGTADKPAEGVAPGGATTRGEPPARPATRRLQPWQQDEQRELQQQRSWLSTSTCRGASRHDASEGAQSRPPWTSLPEEVLVLVIERLRDESRADGHQWVIAAGRVCRLWRGVARDVLLGDTASSPPAPPPPARRLGGALVGDGCARPVYNTRAGAASAAANPLLVRAMQPTPVAVADAADAVGAALDAAEAVEGDLDLAGFPQLQWPPPLPGAEGALEGGEETPQPEPLPSLAAVDGDAEGQEDAPSVDGPSQGAGESVDGGVDLPPQPVPQPPQDEPNPEEGEAEPQQAQGAQQAEATLLGSVFKPITRLFFW